MSCFIVLLGNLISCQKSIDNSTADIIALKTSVSALIKTTDSLSKALSITNNNVANISIKLDSIKSQIIIIQNQITIINNQITINNTNITNINSQILILNQQYIILLTQLNSILIQLTITPTTLSTGLVAYYPFSGNANDSSGYGNNGTVFGAKLNNDRFGKPNSSYIFDGSSNYIKTNTAAIPTSGDYTINLWLNCPSNSNKNTESISQGGTYINSTYIGYVPNGTMRLGGGANWGWESTVNFPFGGWHMFTITKQNNISFLYVDGVILDSSTVYTNPVNSGSTIIGRQQANGIEFWNGSIDDIRIYNRVLNPNEISYLASH